jgi:hypothetical protein
LVQKLVDEVAEMPGALPLVSFALYEMYRNFAQRYIKALKERISIKREITWEDYPEGGVPESLARRANEEYKSLAQDTVSGERINLEPAGAETRKTILRCVMLRMIAVNGNETARKKVLKSELDYETENEQIQNVVDRFLEARLIVGGSDEQNNEYIEPAHDALILQWQELKGWFNENRDKLLLREELTRSSTDWDQNKRRGNDLLHRGEKLEKAEQYSREQRFFLNKLESAYIKACRYLRNRQAKEQAESRSKTSLILFDSHQELDALVEAIRAGVITQREHLEESTSSLTTSILRKIVYGIKELNRLEEHQNWVISVSFSANGEIIATGCRDKTVILWRNNGQKIKSL